MGYFQHFDVSVRVIGTGLNTENPAVLLGIGALCVLLEVWLACREKRWPGLLLPGVVLLWTAGCFLLSYGMAPAFPEKLGLSTLMLVQVFLRNNLPVLGLLVIYGLCRWLRGRKRRRGRELDQTRVDDL